MSNTRVHQIVPNPSSVKTTRRKLYLAMLTASQFMVAGHVLAAPEGGQVVGGAGSIDQSGSNTTIHQTTERMAIDWKSFDVKADERVQFIQPKSTSVALNRVLSNRGSEILGRIDANGKVILVNPNGIVFGIGSQINVGGMIASGLNINPNDFMNGEFTLTAIEGTEGKVINSGIINAATGGSVTLLGKEVKNEGLISAHLGSVNLAAGKAAVVTFDPSGMVGVKITQAVLQNDLGLDAAVINSGEIIAQGGRILITASVSQDIFSQAVNHGGMNQANSVVMNADGSFTLGAGADVINTGSLSTSNTTGDAGQIVLLGDNVSNSGNILADSNAGSAGHIELNSTDTTQLTHTAKISAQALASGTGGDIKILGNKVGLLDSASVNASGVNGGGQILIGGDKTGANKNIRNADFIFLGQNSTVKTDALLNGDGGKLITFASDTARIYGSLSARGGSEAGNGGFIETSGLKGFDIASTPDIGAANGRGGEWLIDPDNIIINATYTAGDFSNPTNASYISNQDNANISWNQIDNGLLGGTVTVQAGNGGSITITADFTFDPGGDHIGTLNLVAANNIVMNNHLINVANNDLLNLSLNAVNDINITGTSSIALSGGNFTAVSKNFTLGNLNSDAAVINTDNGNVAISTKTNGVGAVKIYGNINTDEGNFTVGGAAGNNPLSFENDAFLDAGISKGGRIDTSAQYGGGDISITTAGDISLGTMIFSYNYNDADAKKLKRVGNITVESTGGSVTLVEDLNFNNTANRTGAGAVATGNGETISDDTFLKITAANNITIAGKIYDAWGDSRDAFDINLTSTGSTGVIKIENDVYTAGGNFTAQGNSFTSTGKVINTDLANDDNGANPINASWSNGGNVTIKAITSVDLGSVVTDRAATTQSNVSGNLIIERIDNTSNAKVAVAQTTSAPLNIFGSSTFNLGTHKTLSALTLNNAGNIFTGNILFTNAGNVNLLDTTAINLGASTSTVGGTLTLTANGDISQSGALEVTDLASFDAGTGVGTHNILLNNSNNKFSTVNILNAGDASFSDSASDIALTTTNSVTNLTVSAVGDITDGNTDGIRVTNLADFTTSGNITLDNAANEFIKVNINQVNASENKDVILFDSTGGIELGKASTTFKVDNNFTLTSGPVTQFSSSNITVGRLATFTSSGASIVLNQATNNFGKLAITSATTAEIKDANALELGSILLTGTTADSLKITSITNITQTASTTIANHSGGGVDLSAASVILNNIDTSGATNTAGGAVKIDAGTGVVTVDTIDTRGAGVGKVGGPVTIDGRVITLGNSTNAINSSATDAGGTGSIQITAKGNAPTITLKGDVNSGSKTATLTLSGTDASAGTIDFSQYAGAFTSNINVSGRTDSGAGADTFKGQNIANTWNINTRKIIDTSKINDVAPPTITYSNFENLLGGNNVDIFTINADSTGTLSGGGGDDTFNINTLLTKGTFNGDAGADTFNINITGAQTATLNGGADGSTLGDTIVGFNQTNDWALNTGLNETLNTNLTFSTIENITGGTEKDTFTLATTLASNRTVKGGTGVDDVVLVSVDSIVDFTSASFTLNGVQEAEILQNTAADKKITAKSNSGDAVQWAIGATENSGQITLTSKTVKFVDFSQLTGGLGNDTFTLTGAATITGLINGGAGTNYLDFSAATTRAYSVAISATDTTANLTVTGKNKIIGNDHAASSLTVASGDNEWKIFDFTFTETIADGLNDGTVADVYFVNFRNLIGGDNNDTFDFSTATKGSISGQIDGAGGTDNKIIGRNAGTLWNINNVNGGDSSGGNSSNLSLIDSPGSEYVKSFTSIQHLTGSADFADTFRFANNGSITSADGVEGVGINTVNLSLLDTTKVITLTIGGTSTFNASNVSKFIGNSSDNLTLAIANGINIWEIYDIDDNALSAVVSDGINDGTLNGVVSFVNFKHLQGGTGKDTFDFSLANGGSITGGVNGGGGSLDEIIAPNLATTWNIRKGGTNDLSYGTTTAFNGITILTGSATKVDTYKFTEEIGAPTLPVIGTYTLAAKDDLAGEVLGGVVDVLNLAGVSADINLTVGDTATSGLTISGFEKIILNDTRNNTLTGYSGGSNWAINGKNSGTVASIRMPTTSMIFEGFKNLTGANDAKDNFTFSGTGNIEGTILGGASISSTTENKLTGLVANSNWNITAANGGNIAAVVGNFQNIQILQGSDGGNTFTLSSGITFGGTINGGTGVDTLKATDGTNNFQIDSPNSGKFNDLLTFTEMNKLTGGTGADTFTFNIGTAYGGTIDAGASAGVIDVVDFSALDNAATVNLGANSIQGVINAERVIGNSSAGPQLQSTATSGINTWTIFDFDGAGTAVTNGTNNGTYINNANPLVQFVNFSTLMGAANVVDNFIINNGASIGLVNGGAGAGINSLTKVDGINEWKLTDSVNIGALNTSINFANIQQLTGGTGVDTLVGHNKNNLWTITAENKGTLKDKALPASVSFSNMENLTGNADVDEFKFQDNLANITGLIDGGHTTGYDNPLKLDILDFSLHTDAIALELGNTSVDLLNVTNVETMKAFDNSGNSIVGASVLDASYTWDIDGKNSGSVTITNNMLPEKVVGFTNFYSITGGTQEDRFVVGNLGSAKSIDGGAGNDFVDYSNKAGPVNIGWGGSGLTGVTKIANIEGVVGNNNGSDDALYNSILTVDGDLNEWTIGSTNNVADGTNDGKVDFTVGATKSTIYFENFNILVGGNGKDTFNIVKANTTHGKLTGYINGGTGTNIFNAAASTTNTNPSLANQTIQLLASAKNLSDPSVLINTQGATQLFNFQEVYATAATGSSLAGTNVLNNWAIDNFGNGTLNSTVAFKGFDYLIGSFAQDNLNITALIQNVGVGVGASKLSSSYINIINFEQIDANANANKNNTLLADTLDNNWDLDGNNKGKLNTLLFTGFANLTGGALADTFKFLNSTADIAGIIDAGDGADTVDLLAAGRAVNVNLLNPMRNNTVANNINVINAETINASSNNASSNFINTLTAGDLVNSWSINTTNSGDLNKSPTSTGIIFTNFSNLIGGSLDDTFTYTSTGRVTGYVDGKGHAINGGDTVNLSALNEVDILLSSTQIGYRNIESYVGNNTKSILRSDYIDNAWVLMGTQNNGTINGTTFIGFTTLHGGSGKDTFNITGDSVSGSINGEGGDDSLAVNVISGTTGNINFNGGGDTDTMTVAGGDAGYQAKHILLGDAVGQVSYSSMDASYNISYSSIAIINDNLVAEKLTLNGTQNADDEFTFKATNSYSLTNSPAVFYSNKKNLLIAATDANDKVIINGTINVPNELSILNATVTATTFGSIKANSLNLNATANVGSLAQPLNADIANLSISATRGNIYLQAENNVNITEFFTSTNSLFDFTSNGNLTSSVKLTSLGDVSVVTTIGDIILDKENKLSGKLHLVAGNNINLRNDSITNLSGVTAQSVTVNSTGAINANDGVVKIAGLASFNSGGDINLNNAGNDFNSLTIGAANNAYITDFNFITFTDVAVAKDFVTHSMGVATSGVTSAVNVTLNAGQGLATLTNMTVSEGINVDAQGIVTNGNLTASTIDLNGMNGNVTLNGKLDTASKQTVNIVGKTITQNASITSGGLTSLDARENLFQNADIKSGKNIQVTAGGNLNMLANTTSTGLDISYRAGGTMSLLGTITATNNIQVTAVNDINMGANAANNSTSGNINYSGANLSIATLNAANGNVVLNSTGSVADINASAINITAKRLVVDAATGIGATGLLGTAVAELSLSNMSGSIGIQNTGSVTIERLRTNGHITLNNIGDVVLDNSKGSPFVHNPTDTNALTSFGTSNANYNIGTLRIDVAAGSLTASGAAKITNPDITALNAWLTASNSIGGVTRPLVVYVQNQLQVDAGVFDWKPLYGFGVAPFEDESKYQGNIRDLIGAGAEQLVQVESLEQVNPAIFTGVRNYVYDDIAILMPTDQRYDENDSEE